jgi:ribokinase
MIMDLVVRVPRHPLVGETIAGHDFNRFPGGKGANQAVAAAKADANVTMLGRRGADDFGIDLEAFLKSANVDTSRVSVDKSAPTGVGYVSVADNGANSIIIIPGANDRLSPEVVSKIEISADDTLIAQLEIPTVTIETLFEAGRSAGARTILNAAPATDDADQLLPLTDILVVNEVELAHFARKDVDPGEVSQVAKAVESLRAFDEQIIIVTLGEAGLMGFASNDVIEIPGRSVEAVDTTGAGDCFTGTLAALLSEGASLEKALHFANAAASLSVQATGAGPSMPSRDAVEQIIL